MGTSSYCTQHAEELFAACMQNHHAVHAMGQTIGLWQQQQHCAHCMPTRFADTVINFIAGMTTLQCFKNFPTSIGDVKR